MSTKQHTPHYARHTQSSPSTASSPSSIPSLHDSKKDSSVFIADKHKALLHPTIIKASTAGTSTSRQYPDRTLQSSIETLPIPTEESKTSNNQTMHNHLQCNSSLLAPPGLPPPVPSRRFKPPQEQRAPRCDPVVAGIKQQLHHSYNADLPSKSFNAELLAGTLPSARPSSLLQEFGLLPAIELRSAVSDEGIPPGTKNMRNLEEMCKWSLYDAAREQQEFIRKTEAQKQIYEMAFANLENELAELDVGDDSQECHLALFDDESEEWEREKEEGEINDTDDEGYEQDGGVNISDELEEVSPSSESESGSEIYALSYEVDGEEFLLLPPSEEVGEDICEQEEGYDADNDFEHVANSGSIPHDDLFAMGCPEIFSVQSCQAQASKPIENDLVEGEHCHSYAPVGINKDRERVECCEVLDGEIATPNRDDQPRVFIDSDEEFNQREAEIYQQLERTRPLWSIYSNVLPPARDPPSWYPETHPTFDVEDPDIIPSHRFNRVKTLASGNGLSSVCVVRSVWPQRWNRVGLREDSLWAMKLYPMEHGNTEKKRRAMVLLHMEVDVYMRIAESPKEEKIGFAFLMNLEMTMTFPGNTALLMELMRTDLRTYMDDSQLVQRSIPRLLAQMAMGIATLHSIGVIHRDLKPENIFLDYHGNVKIGDFGTSFLTRTFMALQNDVDYDDSVAGTIEYVSPEVQSEGGMHGIEVDYWALGCVFFEMMVDDHVSLFPRSRPRELEDWIEYSKTQEGRDAFFEYEGFNEDEADLLCGLLRPNPRRRYGIDEILEHKYFLRNNGSSEFRHLEEALSRARREPVFGSDERPRIRITPNPVDDMVFNWANPYGACFADRTRRAAMRGSGSRWT